MILLLLGSPVLAEEPAPIAIYASSADLQDKAPPTDQAKEQHPTALPEFGGQLWCRQYFTGDWCGTRPCLAESGVMFEGNFTQYYQGVSSGGSNTGFQHGGHGTLPPGERTATADR